MSTSVEINTSNQMMVNHDVSKMFLWNNRYKQETFAKAENETGDTIIVPAGTLMGRVTTGGKLKELASGASDGSQAPVGVLAHDVVIADGVTFDGLVTICDAGDIDSAKIVLQGSDTLDTNIGARPIKDLIKTNTTLNLVSSVELTGTDNI